jgi:uncharacterized YigZ family protein
VKRLPDRPNGDELPDSFFTLAGTAESELKVKRSRFVAAAFPVNTVEEAQSRLNEIARRFHDARHVCYGYRLGIANRAVNRKSDAGEPAGTAGEPILAAIAQLDLTDVLVVVVRYFGGVKLGTGGLARAYGQAAEMALTAGGIREVPLGREFNLHFSYSREKTIRHLLEARGGHLVAQDYGPAVAWRIWLPHSTWRGFSAAVTEMTGGEVSLEETGE